MYTAAVFNAKVSGIMLHRDRALTPPTRYQVPGIQQQQPYELKELTKDLHKAGVLEVPTKSYRTYYNG